MLLCPGKVPTDGLVFVLVTFIIKATFVKQHSKSKGSSGLHYILLEVMKRKKLTSEVFKNKKFQENNLIQVSEAIRDVCKAYGIAAALEFSESESFPVQQELRGAADVSTLLLDKFKDWISDSSENDVSFQHRPVNHISCLWSNSEIV